ncbi:hypothetical protein QCE79_30995 [Caballeronia sp. LZ003]|nr:hypothetical protein [Caballeronia sp. LZ003]
MAKTIHGCSESGTWKSWVDMRARCYSKSNKAFRDYGGRGITVCDEWKESFSAFLRDMGERPDGLTLERIDVNGRYDKTNCKWADRVEQARNKRDNRVITFGGERRTLAEWSEITGIPHYVISARIDSFWSLEQALTQRPRLGFRRTTAQRASDESAFYATRYEVAE